MLIAPVWKAQGWYPVLPEVLVKIYNIPDHPEGRSHHRPTSREPLRSSVPTNCVGYLQKCYEEYKILGRASKLLSGIMETKLIKVI